MGREFAVSAVDASRIADLSRAAGEAVRQGNMDAAVGLWQQVLVIEPGRPEALLFLGQHALHRGDPTGAKVLLERAGSAAPTNPIVWLNLSFVHRALGNAEAESEALERALAADPYCFPALLGKGAFLERFGHKRQAAKVYKDAITIAPPDAQLPNLMKVALDRARDSVRGNIDQMQSFLDQRLKSAFDRHSGIDRRRIDECIGIATGAQKVYVHQPTMLQVPQLPALGYYDLSLFPWVEKLEAGTETVRRELLSLLEADQSELVPYLRHPAGVPLNQWAELNFSPRWSAYFLWEHGERFHDHCARCPGTAALLESIPMADVPGFTPVAFFSVLSPHTKIPPHTGVTNARLTVHLPLIVPSNCHFRVGNEVREWQVGHTFIFDDTIEHEAWNDSDKLRVVLIFDIWNPFLAQAERELICELLGAVRDYYLP
jgi:aspartyl/asparaginyl beta-hydroxylase (cupin superfamily)